MICVDVDWSLWRPCKLVSKAGVKVVPCLVSWDMVLTRMLTMCPQANLLEFVLKSFKHSELPEANAVNEREIMAMI